MEDERDCRVGTEHYKSINITGPVGDISSASLRDDCISAFYVLLELYCGKLPWDHLERHQREELYNAKVDYLDEEKWNARFPELLPFWSILNELHKLDFAGKPQYSTIKQILDDMKNHRYYRPAEHLDWLIEENGFDVLW